MEQREEVIIMKKRSNYDITVNITQRCNARCSMCNLWANPTKPEDEISLRVLEKIPQCKLLKITGGEPFVRNDIKDVVALLHKKTERLLINTNGYFTEKIVDLCREFPDLAIRISMDGEKETHNGIRGIDIYDKAMDTIRRLKRINVKDVGVNFTLQENNYQDLLPVYHRALEMKIDFACSVVHNSFYFIKDDNQINSRDLVEKELHGLIKEELHSKRKKDWGRAFIHDFTVQYMNGKDLPLACDAGLDSFFIDVDGKVLPCNMTVNPLVMGNLNESEWMDIIQSDNAKRIVSKCKQCKGCWMICNMQTALKKKLWIPAWWLIRNKFL